MHTLAITSNDSVSSFTSMPRTLRLIEPSMDAAIRAELDDFVERRKREGGAPTDF